MESITSAPYLIDPVQFGLNDEAKNKERLAKIKKNKSKVILTYAGESVVEYILSDRESFIILEDAGVITYLVHLVKTHLKQFESLTVTQVELWRTKGTLSRAPSGITKHVFDYLLKTYKIVVSDKSQTPDGKDFWIGELRFYHGTGHAVGLFDEDEEEVSWAPKDAPIGAWLRTSSTNAWGKEHKHYYMRFVIAQPSAIK